MRCGECNGEYSALAFLFDQWPEQKAKPPSVNAHGNPPVLGGYGARPGVAGKKPSSAAAPKVVDSSKKSADDNRGIWFVVVVVLALVTISHVAWTFRNPLLENHEIRSFLERLDVVEIESRQPYRNPARVRLVSRDMHLHPTRAGILVLSATFVNLAAREQPFPVLSIILLDAENRPLATRAFQPEEYLLDRVEPDSLMAADVHVPFLLEFEDPGEKAVGFEMQFE